MNLARKCLTTSATSSLPLWSSTKSCGFLDAAFPESVAAHFKDGGTATATKNRLPEHPTWAALAPIFGELD